MGKTSYQCLRHEPFQSLTTFQPRYLLLNQVLLSIVSMYPFIQSLRNCRRPHLALVSPRALARLGKETRRRMESDVPHQRFCHTAPSALSKPGYSHSTVRSPVASKGGDTTGFPNSWPWLFRAWLAQLPPADVWIWMKGIGLVYQAMSFS